MAGGTVFDASKQYRYRLWRSWDCTRSRVAFILLNPSTADAERDDPTIRRCIGFARRWGYGGVDVVNLFAYRATDPRVLCRVADPVGFDNDRHILAVVRRCIRVVAAWGAHGALYDRGEAVITLLRRRAALHVLRITQAGFPRHPLYLPQELTPLRWIDRARF